MRARAVAPEFDARRWIPYLIFWPLVGLIGIVLYAWNLTASVLAVALLVAGAAFVSGGLLGFLFGIPRALTTEATPSSAPQQSATGVAAGTAARHTPYGPNTNLEQISDWLTKILVGVGLVELSNLSAATKRLVDFLAPALGGNDSSPAFALALLSFYGVVGFLIVYLMTRVYLGPVFAHSDELIQRIDVVE
jgi:hypothetical protein